MKDNKRKGLSKRHNLILDLTEEVRTLRAEVEDVLFYVSRSSLQLEVTACFRYSIKGAFFTIISVTTVNHPAHLQHQLNFCLILLDCKSKKTHFSSSTKIFFRMKNMTHDLVLLTHARLSSIFRLGLYQDSENGWSRSHHLVKSAIFVVLNRNFLRRSKILQQLNFLDSIVELFDV